MLYVGTSGYGYHEWSPAFYPQDLAYEDYLTHYAQEFDFCELNCTFFRLPSASMIRQLLRNRDSLVVSVKLHRQLTHARTDELTLARYFAESIAPLVEARMLHVVLAQFPFSFVNNPYNRAYLCRLRAAMELPLVVELRNASWNKPETLAFLKGWGIGLVSIDLPAIASLPLPSVVSTSRVGYIRFHGRRADVWWKGTCRYGRHEYRYRRRELTSWLPRIRRIARDTDRLYIVFNNHRRGYALENARLLRTLLHRSASRQRARTAAASELWYA